ncbi:MAG TPA: flagellin [Pirellulaceae bacterium]|nr:flagellin [Pirellulaceae bacterium]
MSRINTNVSSLIAQKILGRTNNQLQEALNRLSTGLRINVGKDDPAGLIASENLRRDIASANKAISNTERANQLIGTADSALGQISGLLIDIRGLVVEAANTGVLSDEQLAANQLQVDSSLEAIDRISQVTTFQGRKLLDGSLDFQITYTAGGATVEDLNIDQANLGTAGSVAVDIQISVAATQALITNAALPLTDDLVVKIAGQKGSEVFTFELGATVTQIVDAVNLVSDATGVQATDNGGTLELESTDYGSAAFVDVEVLEEGALGTFEAGLSATREVGIDIAATVNGVTANGAGNTLSINTSTLDLSLTVADGSAVAVQFTIDGGGALFQLGPQIVSNQQARIGIGSVNTGELGGVPGRLYQLRSGNDADLTTDARTASLIVDVAINKVTGLRGRLGAFQRATLETNIASLQDTVTNLAEAESSIRDADFAAETARLTRAQILVQSGTSVLAIANQNPQNVLALLRG